MHFIMPDEFSDISEQLRAVFKTKGDSKITLLAQQRVSRAKKMMTPFVLRRRKDQVSAGGKLLRPPRLSDIIGSTRFAQEAREDRVV